MPFYKSFDNNFCYNKVQYTVGEITIDERDLKISEHGIVCYNQALATIQEYPPKVRLCEVLPIGECITMNDSRSRCRGIKVVREIMGDERVTLLSGEYKCHRENGDLFETSIYNDGKLEGPCKTWYPNGQLNQESMSKDGKRNGLDKCFLPNGQPWYERLFEDGKSMGLVKKWSEGVVVDPVY